MDDTAYRYVPAACESEQCRVHIVMHGCQQGRAEIGEGYVSTKGYNEVADTNSLIVLYPQVEPGTAVLFNSKGCWDFRGYSSTNTFAPDFYTHDPA